MDTGRRLIFLDETGCNLNMTRRYGRAPRGVRLVDKSVPRNTPTNRSLVGAMSREGILTGMEVEGSPSTATRFRLPGKLPGSLPAARRRGAHG